MEQDAVNRKMAIKMLIDTGKAADGTQFILISPQSMSGLSAGPEVRSLPRLRRVDIDVLSPLGPSDKDARSRSRSR
jgi:hypothetical protein